MRDVGASRSWKRQETDAPQRFQEGLPCPHLDFGPFEISDLQNYRRRNFDWVIVVSLEEEMATSSSTLA